jgi:hypothetical protein
MAVGIDLDVVAPGRVDDPAASSLLRSLALELGLVEAGDRVADVGRIVDLEVLPAVPVDVRELARPPAITSLGIESRSGTGANVLVIPAAGRTTRRSIEVPRGPGASARRYR